MADILVRARRTSIFPFITFLLGAAMSFCVSHILSEHYMPAQVPVLNTVVPVGPSVPSNTSNMIVYEQTFPKEKIQYGDVVNSVLYRQGISHIAFHSPGFKILLLSLVHFRNQVAVVGVEYGEEVLQLARHGYTVHAFEPMTPFHDSVKEISKNERLKVHMHKMAAGSDRNGTMDVEYRTDIQHINETVPRGRIEDYVHGELDVLSVDIQGNELDVLKGAQRLFESDGVRSLWLEIFPCSDKVAEIFDMLKEDYVIFDFVPWGEANDEYGFGSTGISFAEMTDLKLWKSRPKNPENYLDWFCETRTKHFKWLQSDILAIRRDLVTEDVIEKLSLVSNDALVRFSEAEKAEDM